MKYTKVRVFESVDPDYLERFINTFLEDDKVVDLVDIKYATMPAGDGERSAYSAMIIYRAMPIG